MGISKLFNAESPSLGQWAILTAYRGSVTHGMYVHPGEPTSIDDKDVMACCVPPIEYYFGLQEFGARGTKEIKQGEWDIVLFEVRKFIALLAQGHPNVLPMLWLDPEYFIQTTAPGQMLIENRQLFVGRHAYRGFTVYAQGQHQRMTDLPFEGYLGEKRKGLVKKFGYDTKNAAHLIRLLRMAAEFMKDGELYVKRHDAQQLLAIKRGEWTLEQVKAEANRGFKLAEQAYLESTLPAEPDMKAINKLSVAIVELTLSAR